MVTNELPVWARHGLDDTGVERVERAIAEAESRTSGEIVPILVRRSSTVGHVALLTFTLLLLCVYLFDLPALLVTFGGPHWAWLAGCWAVAALLAITLSGLDLVQRLLTPKPDQIRQVDQRAELEFYELGVGHTRGQTGILLFVSLMEHRAVVLADRAIAEKLDPKVWEEIVELMITGVKRGDLAGGMTQAIERCGELLTPLFPIEHDDTNELRDHLVVKD